MIFLFILPSLVICEHVPKKPPHGPGGVQSQSNLGINVPIIPIINNPQGQLQNVQNFDQPATTLPTSQSTRQTNSLSTINPSLFGIDGGAADGPKNGGANNVFDIRNSPNNNNNNNINNNNNNNKKQSDTKSCFAYDRRYQAATVEEAIMNFPDLTMNSWQVQKYNVNGTSDKPKCTDDQCRACANSILHRLETIGYVNGGESEKIRQNLNLGPKNSFLTTQQCPRLYLDQRIPMLSNSIPVRNNNPTLTFADEIPSIIDKLSKAGNQNWISRSKRQSDLATIGKQTNIKCVKRGEPLDPETMEWINLCAMCWVWRRLPDNYYPQIINELNCDSDLRCLSGWGTCKQGTKNIDVLQKVESPPGTVNWVPVTMQSTSHCNCEIKSGSALHNLVTG